MAGYEHILDTYGSIATPSGQMLDAARNSDWVPLPRVESAARSQPFLTCCETPRKLRTGKNIKQARVEAQLPNDNFKVPIAGRALPLNLPQSAQATAPDQRAAVAAYNRA